MKPNEDKPSGIMSLLILASQFLGVSLIIVVVAISTMAPIHKAQTAPTAPKYATSFDVAREVVAPHVTAFRLLKYGNKRYASGFHINFLGKTYIMTNKHVCDISTELKMGTTIQFDNVLEEIIAIDTKHDLCLVTSTYHQGGLVLAARDLQPLEPMLLVGHPRGLDMVVREGRLMGTYTDVVPWITNIEPVRIHQVSSPAYGGNSGSPVTNSRGEVVGVLFAGIDEFPLEPFVIPHEYLVRFLMETVLGK
jgi:serine protease Do